MKLLGLDIGTTGICGIVFDTTLHDTVCSVTLSNDSFKKSIKNFERVQDISVILSTVYDVIGKIDTDYDAIGISGQMHGVVYVDAHGNAVSDLYTWQDQRGAEIYKDGKSYAAYLGCFPGYGLASDLYNQENNLIPADAKYLCTVGDFVAMKLCGNKAPVIHITNAASLGCFDVKTNQFTTDNPRLPEVITSFSAIGKTEDGKPVCVAIGDNQAGFIGSVSNADDVLINMGTGAQISYLVDSADIETDAEIRPFDSDKFLAAGCSLCGGRAFAMFEKFCREIANDAGADIENFYPHLNFCDDFSTDVYADCRFCGTRKDPSVKGAVLGISEDNFSYKNFAYAILDGMVKELFDMYDKKKSNGNFICCGNAIRKNPVIKKIISRYFGSAPLSTVYNEEAAVGAAFTAAVADDYCDEIFDIMS